MPVVGRGVFALSLPLPEVFLPREIFFCKQPVSVPGKFRDARPTWFANFTELLGKLTAVDNLRFRYCVAKCRKVFDTFLRDFPVKLFCQLNLNNVKHRFCAFAHRARPYRGLDVVSERRRQGNRCRTSSQHRRRQLKKRVTPAGVAFILYTLRRAGFTLNEIDEMPASHAFQFSTALYALKASKRGSRSKRLLSKSKIGKSKECLVHRIECVEGPLKAGRKN